MASAKIATPHLRLAGLTSSCFPRKQESAPREERVKRTWGRLDREQLCILLPCPRLQLCSLCRLSPALRGDLPSSAHPGTWLQRTGGLRPGPQPRLWGICKPGKAEGEHRGSPQPWGTTSPRLSEPEECVRASIALSLLKKKAELEDGSAGRVQVCLRPQQPCENKLRV